MSLAIIEQFSQADHVFVKLKKETINQLIEYLASQDNTTTTYDDIIQEWVNWQRKAAQEKPA